MSVNAVRLKQLADAYSRNTGEVVAFLDESYFVPSFRPDSQVEAFYLLAAYIVPVENLDVMREDLPDVVQSNYWHSTQSHQSDEGQERIRSFTSYIGQGTESIIVTIQQPVVAEDTNGEWARQACFQRMLGVLAAGEACPVVSLAIFEERKFQSQRNADARTIKVARTSGVIPRSMAVLPTSPAYEKLLWLPDVVCFAIYQSMSGGRGDYLEPFGSRVQDIRVDSVR